MTENRAEVPQCSEDGRFRCVAVDDSTCWSVVTHKHLAVLLKRSEVPLLLPVAQLRPQYVLTFCVCVCARSQTCTVQWAGSGVLVC